MQRSLRSLGPIALCFTSVVLAVACGDDGDSVSCQTSCGGESGSSTEGGTSAGKASGGSMSEGGVVDEAGTGGTAGTATGGTAGTATGGTAGTATGGTAGTATGGTAGTASGGSAGRGGTAGTTSGGTAGTATGMIGGAPSDAGMAGQPMNDAGAAGLGGAPTGPVGPTITGDIILQYNFSENTGTTAVDSTVNHLDGTLTDTTWVPGRNGAGVSLAAATSLVTLPAGIVSSATEFTAATWVYLTASDTWPRIFDFGDDSENYMFLTTKSNAANGGSTRFAMKVHGAAEEMVEVPAVIPLNVWKHIAVTISASGARLYVDGHQVASNPTFAGKPANLGVTQQNWIGKSRFPDPALKGQLDEFYLYKRALSEKEIQTLAWPKTDYSIYHFDETTGATAVDSSDNAKNATLAGVAPPTFSGGRMGNALTMAAVGESYATLPAGIVSGCTDMTIATWINMTANDRFNRVFDFGFDTNAFIFITPNNENSNLQFAIKAANVNPGVVQAPAGLTLNAWHHVAAVMDGTTARLYADGNPIGTSTFPSSPAAVGVTPNNYIGKSQFPDPNYRGRIDEMIISCRAFTAGEIKMLAQ